MITGRLLEIGGTIKIFKKITKRCAVRDGGKKRNLYHPVRANLKTLLAETLSKQLLLSPGSESRGRGRRATGRAFSFRPIMRRADRDDGPGVLAARVYIHYITYTK